MCVCVCVCVCELGQELWLSLSLLPAHTAASILTLNPPHTHNKKKTQTRAQRRYYRAALDWMEQGTGPEWVVQGVFAWNLVSW